MNKCSANGKADHSFPKQQKTALCRLVLTIAHITNCGHESVTIETPRSKYLKMRAGTLTCQQVKILAKRSESKKIYTRHHTMKKYLLKRLLNTSHLNRVQH
eukprot:151961-Pleurochrysis_carterae.AAC.1